MIWTTDQLKQHVDALAAERLKLGLAVAVGIVAVLITMNAGNSKAISIALEGERLARTVALDQANEKGRLHNDLIRKGERSAATYVTRGQVYSALGTALVIIGLLIAWFSRVVGH